jgi:hypothetical protein
MNYCASCIRSGVILIQAEIDGRHFRLCLRCARGEIRDVATPPPPAFEGGTPKRIMAVLSSTTDELSADDILRRLGYEQSGPRRGNRAAGCVYQALTRMTKAGRISSRGSRPVTMYKVA